jgi:hypothetical protein
LDRFWSFASVVRKFFVLFDLLQEVFLQPITDKEEFLFNDICRKSELLKLGFENGPFRYSGFL